MEEALNETKISGQNAWSSWKINSGRQIRDGNQNSKYYYTSSKLPTFPLPKSPDLDSKASWNPELHMESRQGDLQKSSVSGPKNRKGALWIIESWKKKTFFPIFSHSSCRQSHTVLELVLAREAEQVPKTQRGGFVFLFFWPERLVPKAWGKCSLFFFSVYPPTTEPQKQTNCGKGTTERRN